MSAFLNAAPMTNLEGIQDLSGRTVPREPVKIPMHLPQVFSFAERGPRKNQLISGADGNRLYGANSFERKGPFATHVTPFYKAFTKNANNVMFKRMVPDDALRAGSTLYARLTPAQLPIYSRDSEGRYSRDENGELVSTGDTVGGYKIHWYSRPLTYVDGPDGFKIVGRSVGGESDDGSGGKILDMPILDIPAAFEGSYGNNIGYRLSVPTVNSMTPPDMELADSAKAVILRLQVLERPNVMSSAVAVKNLDGEQAIDFVLKPDVTDKYNREKFIDRAVVPSYKAVDETTGLPPVYGPVDDVHFYRDNYERILTAVKQKEDAVDETISDPGLALRNLDMDELNIFTGMTLEEIPYFALQMSDDVDDNSLVFSEYATHYLTNGSDGTLTEENLGTLVSRVMSSGWDDPEDPLRDDAKNPFSIVWDSGFDMMVKRDLCQVLGARKDTGVILATHVAGEGKLSWSAEESRAVMLRDYAAAYPESEVHGTACCRAIVFGGSGVVADGSWVERVPLSLDWAVKVARFMGAGNGKMKPGLCWDESPNNQITYLRDITGTYKTARQRTKDWAAGMVWAQTYDIRSAFYPAVQTVYTDDTSILNSAVNMLIAMELEKVAQNTWRQLTGNSKMNNEQFIQKSNELIEKATRDRFDDRVVIVPETFMTPSDELRGFSWSCRINMYGNNMKTVGTFTIVARRSSDLEQ